MFTGIIEALGTVVKVERNGTNKTFYITSPISNELNVDQSLSHNGICLTVEAIELNTHKVTAILETLQKTNLDQCKTGDKINLERCLRMNGRLDGHLVQGHIDTTAVCRKITPLGGSWEFQFEFPDKFAELIIEKGSVCCNGVSLTVFNITRSTFIVAIIPYTYLNTNLQDLKIGESINVEFDMIGKYINRYVQLNKTEATQLL